MNLTQLVVGFLCTLAKQPGPKTYLIQDMNFQMYSINRRLCPGIDPLRDTIFELYTRSNPEAPQILRRNDIDSVTYSNMDFQNPTVMFFHGFLESSQSDDAQQIKNAYLRLGNYNVILVNNRRLLAGINYVTAALNCRPIGKFSGMFIDFLVSLGLELSMLHIIGMSLGAHIAGLTGRNIASGRAARVTGLDPAGPLFSKFSQDERIGPEDAEFVDIIHTNTNAMGINIKSGDVDIWFNGGTVQPGCSIQEVRKRKPNSIGELIFCSHYQAYRSYVQALYIPDSYIITKCSSYKDYLHGSCNDSERLYLGEYIDQRSKGDYYITTGITAIDI